MDILGASEMAKSSYVAPSREGLVALTVFVRPEVRQDLKIAAATHDTTVAAILEEAVATALKRYKPKK